MSDTPITPTPTLATRCSACNTAFRVVQDQLKVSEGWVRCGRCGEVFNALDRIFDLEQARRQTAPPEDGVQEAATTSALVPELEEDRLSAPDIPPEPLPQAASAPASPVPAAPAPGPAQWPDLSNLPVDDNTDLRLIDPEFAKAHQDAQAAGFASALIETEGSGPEPLSPWTLPPAPAKKSRRSRRAAAAESEAPSPPAAPSTLDFVLPDLDVNDDDDQTDISLDALHAQASLTDKGAPVLEPGPMPAGTSPAAAPAASSHTQDRTQDPASAPAQAPGGRTAARADQSRLASGSEMDDGLPVLEDGISRFPRWVFPDESEVTGDSSLSQMGQTDGPSSLGPDEGHDTPEFVRDAERQARWRHPRMRWVLGTAGAVLSVLLLLQVGVIWRDGLAADHPALRGPLASACAALGCELAPPRRIEEIVVESSGLTKAAGERNGEEIYKLNFVLRNRSGTTLRLPAIELTLTDANGGIVSRKVLAGADLHARADAAMEPGGEVPLYALLSTPGHAVAGYTIEVFYP